MEPVVGAYPGLDDPGLRAVLFFNDFIGELRLNTFYFRLELIRNVLRL